MGKYEKITGLVFGFLVWFLPIMLYLIAKGNYGSRASDEKNNTFIGLTITYVILSFFTFLLYATGNISYGNNIGLITFMFYFIFLGLAGSYVSKST